MSRPTTYCAVCGEYVAEDWFTVHQGGSYRTVKRLVHVDAVGKRIFRNHKPVLETPETMPSRTAKLGGRVVRTNPHLSQIAAQNPGGWSPF